MVTPKLTALGPQMLRDIQWTIEQVKRIVRGNLTPDPRDPGRAADDIVAWIPKDGIPRREGATLHGVYCDLYRIYDSDPDDDLIELEAITDDYGVPFQRRVFNPGDWPIHGDVYAVTSLLKSGHRWTAQRSLTGGCLAEDHPGRGIGFNIYLGVWDPDYDNWSYDTSEEPAWAIDWRYGVPYPDAGATGLFEPRGSTYYGTIWECVALDCESPGECYYYGDPGGEGD